MRKRDSLTNIELKLLKAQHKAHKKKYNTVRKKVRAITDLKYKDYKVLEADLKEVNSDLMNVLFYYEPPFKDVADYFDTINAYLLSETTCYDYGTDKEGKPVKLGYMPTKMAFLMAMIREQHNRIDRFEELKEKIGL